MKKEYGWILITYILMQFSGLIGGPLLYKAGVPEALVPGYWTVISFALATLIILIMLWRSTYRNAIERQAPVSAAWAVVWSILGVFMAFAAQIIAVSIETKIGIPQGSENTQQIIELVQGLPLVILSVAVFGPILEEIVFRKIIFGSLYNRMPFFFAALISSLVFSVAHTELEHTILYAAMGFTFAFLYVKTKRIIVPIMAHVSMNTFVVLMQYVFADDIQEMIRKAEEMEQMSQWISWF
ncbi:CPBP family intramembrane glutamic endopeptidase [Domibacillus iocasae]|uniref:Abortive infection protein n=1 Tax=Domibacillus iocasae TaxID=1714016 RepID=A0A1E7DQQ9_9BACI|nr:type II CAAX endopeptidase family protein [Domibacillus iocasae]OES45394.1 abortive infection protein [Domibacillus iocasae]